MKKITLSKQKQKTWKAFSLYVRLKDADINGLTMCITCGQKKDFKKMQAGHLIPGRNNAVLFSEDGVHPQCYSCNIMKNGNWPAYYEFMKKTYGQQIIDDLIQESRQVVKYTISDLQELEKYYKEQVKKYL